MMKNLKFALGIILLLFAACGTSTDFSNSPVVKISCNEHRQEIDGFGGSNAWTRPPRDYEAAQELAKLLFSKTEGVGFTILRNRIPFRERLPEDDSPGLNDGFVVRKSDNTYDYTVNQDGTKTFNLNWSSWDIAGTRDFIRYILELGAQGPENLVIMSTPWTPPNNRVTRWKEDVTGVNANYNYTIDWTKPDIWGKLRRNVYNDYADLLADYAKNFETRMGHPLAVLSVQNEPNYRVQYESAYWNGNDIRDFLKIIGQRFPMKGITLGAGGLGIMAPEFESFNINFNNMIKPSLDDPDSEKVLTHIALHQYNGASDTSPRAGSMSHPQIVESGKRFWQTEVSGSGNQIPAGTGIDNALYYARMIHYDMTLAQTNAFLYWWLWTGSSNNIQGSLIFIEDDELKPAVRLYAMGQYSRFIRPGWVRIECDAAPTTGVYCSAYRNPQTNEIAVVIINEKITASPVSLDLEGAEFDQLAIWRTSENEKLKSIGRQRISRTSANVNIQPRSITTLYGTVK